MGSNGPGNPIVYELIGLIALSLLLVIVGFAVRRRGGLATRGAALAWAVLCILPLFGTAFVFGAKQQVQEAEGTLPTNGDIAPARGAP